MASRRRCSAALRVSDTSSCGCITCTCCPPYCSGSDPMSRWSVAETLAHIAPEVPSALVTPAAHAAALAVAARLPAALTRWMYLECRLAAGVTETDLIVSVDAESRDILAGDGTPRWPRLRAFASEWA